MYTNSTLRSRLPVPFCHNPGCLRRSFLNITRQPYEEPYHVNLLVAAGNLSTQAQFEIYANASDLNVAALSLTGFPKTDNDTFSWELGSDKEQGRFEFYFRLRVFQFSSSGRCAIEIKFNNNQKPPNQQIVEFCIDAYPPDLDRLGTILKSFGRLEGANGDCPHFCSPLLFKLLGRFVFSSGKYSQT